MSIKEQYEQLSQALQKLYSKGEAESIGSWVMEHYTGLGRMAIKTNGGKQVSIHEKQLIGRALNELLKHKPVQYVLGQAWFKNMLFFVDENVLIPRPETEELVDWVIQSIKGTQSEKRILDIGTGSGCIAISIKKDLPNLQVTAIDISEAALQLARRNADKFKAIIQFTTLNFLSIETWSELPKYDVIVSNPPYIPVNEKDKLDKNVTEWEPGMALFVPDDDPLLFYKKIAEFGKSHLQINGSIFVECHQDFAKATQQMFVAAGYETQLKKDLFDNERMLKAVRN